MCGLTEQNQPSDASFIYRWRQSSLAQLMFEVAPEWLYPDGGIGFTAEIINPDAPASRTPREIWVFRMKVVDERYDTFMYFDGDILGMPDREVSECHGKIQSDGSGWLWYGRLRETGPSRNT